MLQTRKVTTASGATSVQVVQYQNDKTIVRKHIGSSHDRDKLSKLIQKANEWILKETRQFSFFEDRAEKTLYVNRSECIAVTHQFARDFFLSCFKECGLLELDALLIDLAMMRLIEPASKLRTINLLLQYFGVSYSQRIYANIPKLLTLKNVVEEHAYRIASEKFNEPFYYVLYDVTTLYFESFKSDELRIQGFSKDNKSQQPQIIIGLLVTQSGFPLIYDVFPGNTFEGHTMLPVIERFVNKHKHIKPIIVADAAMLSEERLEELRSKNISYIVGARLANSNLALIKNISGSLNCKNGSAIRVSTQHGNLVCNFSEKRFKKEKHELNKLIKKAETFVSQQSSGKGTKFVKRVSKEIVELNKPLIEKRKLLLGIKGYVTDIPEEKMSNEKIVEHYHNLWRVEQTFRMSKNDIQSRPIFHFKEDSVRSHVLICFVALMIEKYLELTTKMSLRQIRDIIWNITEAHIQDTQTKEIYTFRSPTKDLMESPLADLTKKWKLLPY
jgi:transposase